MRMIDADEAIINFGFEWDDICPTRDEVVSFLRKQKTIDAVPVVRCKDCKHYNTAGCSVGFGWCESMDRGVSDDFYCSYGAKMEDKP